MVWWIIGVGAASLVALFLAMLRAGKADDDARWRALGLDPEQVRNEEESKALKAWADRRKK